ncbi:ABCA3.2 family protein [Megaselia abdita]
MLTGEISSTSGSAYVFGYDVRKHLFEARKYLGYCPQFDALFYSLTIKQNLKIYCMIKGVPKSFIDQVIENLQHSFGIPNIKKKITSCTKSTHRKVSIIISLIGCAPLLLLDDPTGGMHPTDQTKFWNIVSVLRETGKTIILTSHSVEEIEEVCTRMAVMVNGVFKCIGASQHLKNRFSKGLILKVKMQTTKSIPIYRSMLECGTSDLEVRLASMESLEEEPGEQVVATDFDRLHNFIITKFTSAILTAQFERYLIYHVPTSARQVRWSYIFGVMEQIKEEYYIEDYTISQTTLEEVFFSLAGNQLMKKQKNRFKC